MKKIDKDGLSLCRLQGNVFVSSLDNTECSSEIFMRRFMTSEISIEFDSLAVLDDSLTIIDIIQKIDEEFGKTSYGKVKYEKEVMFWIGYIYRYFAYTYDLSSKYVYKLIKPKELNELYYVYHSFDPSVAIERILEEKNISFDQDHQNNELLKLLRKRHYEKEIELKEMKAEYFCDFANDCSFFKDEPIFKEYLHSKEKEGYILLAIKYKDEIVGKVCLKKIIDDSYKFGIILDDDKYRNKGLGTVVIKKAMITASDMGIKSLEAEIQKNDQRSIHVFKKLGFEYSKETNDSAYYTKALV